MKTYRWCPEDRTVDVLSGSRTVKLKHVLKHSFDGFQCGYGGTGPADLALSILMDCINCHEAELYYNEFKWDFIRPQSPARHWEITEDEIKVWLTPRRELSLRRKLEGLRA